MSGLATDAPRASVGRAGSFAEHVFRDVFPDLVASLLSDHSDPLSRARLTELGESLSDGGPSPVHPSHDGAEYWNRLFQESLRGTAWNDLESYVAEAYFYAMVLDAVGYFAHGPGRHCDPFRTRKSAELRSEGFATDVEAFAGLCQGSQTAQDLQDAFEAALWSNQSDLTHTISSSSGADGRIIVDQRDTAASHVVGAGPLTIVIVCDNAGRELLADLRLAHALLSVDPGSRVALHLKDRPFFISDATAGDLADLLGAVQGTYEPVFRCITEHIRSRRLTVRSHPFYGRAETLAAMPDDLLRSYESANFVIMKGDLNYRRLFDDRLLDPTVSFDGSRAVRSFDVVVARALKSDTVAGIDPDLVKQLTGSSPDWMTCGRFGVIQVAGREEVHR